MDVLSKVAHKNKMKILYHEKPFKGVNGSGKHCNWSMSTDHGENLLDPTVKPETNYRFLLILVASRPIKNFSMPEIQTITLGGTALDVKVASLPSISRDLTDRNRTSPFAFTGNKFEFRAVGSKQSPSFPVTILNAAVASALQDVSAALREQMGEKPFPSDADKLAVIKKFI
ncbi:hypothetical protein BGZ68_004133, partial [Mortierella alpina]